MTASPEDRLTHLEQALVDLVERTLVLERALAFEVAQREAMETVLTRLAGVPCRVDRLEQSAIEGRKGGRVRGAAA